MSIRSMVSGMLRGMLRKTGREVVAYDPRHFFILQRSRLVATRKIDLVLDVGANTGQTGLEFRDQGYVGRIVSFEPLSGPFAELESAAAQDGHWDAMQTALGERTGSAQINVSGFSQSSSLLPMDKRHVSLLAESQYVGTETVRISRLDDLFPGLVRPGERILLKVDTQGFELAVLRGADKSLQRIDLVQLEVSFVELYEGGAKYHEVMRLMDEQGFDLVGISLSQFEERSTQFLQADALFVRRGIDGCPMSTSKQIHPPSC